MPVSRPSGLVNESDETEPSITLNNSRMQCSTSWSDAGVILKGGWQSNGSLNVLGSDHLRDRVVSTFSRVSLLTYFPSAEAGRKSFHRLSIPPPLQRPNPISPSLHHRNRCYDSSEVWDLDRQRNPSDIAAVRYRLRALGHVYRQHNVIILYPIVNVGPPVIDLFHQSRRHALSVQPGLR